MLAPAFWFGDRPFVAVGVLQWSLALTLAAGIYRWARPLGRHAALFAVLATCGHSAFAVYYRRPLSEIAFLAAMTWCALALDRVRTAADVRTRSAWAAGGTLLLLRRMGGFYLIM